jgi:S-adenosylmethionine hydrolase
MQSNPTITFTTDFGYENPFVGIMKGVILSINQSVSLIDITHDISPQNIHEGAYALKTSYKSFPHYTIHIAVVDPGVGSSRRPILVSSDQYYFVGPDNGLFSAIYSSSESLTVIHITAEHYFLSNRPSTFQGRDIFAPVAAWLSKGINISKFGDPITDYVTISLSEPVVSIGNTIEGEVIYKDHFGNAITNIDIKKLKEFSRNNQNVTLRISIKGIEAPFKKFYAQAEDNGLYCLINSFGYLEFFVYKQNASSAFQIDTGEKVTVNLT